MKKKKQNPTPGRVNKEKGGKKKKIPVNLDSLVHNIKKRNQSNTDC